MLEQYLLRNRNGNGSLIHSCLELINAVSQPNIVGPQCNLEKSTAKDDVFDDQIFY